MSWRQVQFRDFVTLQRGFDLPETVMQDGDVPVLGSNCVIGFHNEAKVQPPGVITGRSGTLGEVQFVNEPYWPHNTALWVRDFKGNLPRFVYYKLQTLQLDKFSSGASVPTLNRNNLDNIPVKLPSNYEQERIADVLSAHDELIENNRRRMRLLEEAARLLYREWFVRFRFPATSTPAFSTASRKAGNARRS
jgi:type I restriction enzyme S subunit